MVVELANQAHVIGSGVAVNLTPPPSPSGLNLVRPEALAELCESTGGSLIGSDQDPKFPDAVYLLGLSLDNVKAHGGVHQIKVLVKDPRKLTVRAPRTYTAPQ